MSAPQHLWVPEGVAGNYGDIVADVAELIGRPLDAAQRIAVDALTSHRRDGRWLALEGCVKMPRQNGKTAGVITPIALADLFVWGADRVAWTAHLFRTAREAFADHLQLIEGVPELRRRVKRVTQANGEEGIELISGARIDYLARSKGGGRGLGGKRVVIDEALFFTPEQAGALLPILAAREDPQIVYGSSACVAESGQLRRLTMRGRAGGDPSLALAEWCAPGSLAEPGCAGGLDCVHVVGSPGCALDDVELWRAANPAVAGGRVGLDFLRSMRSTLAPQEFAREFLGWDEPDPGEGGGPIAVGAWEGTAVPVGEAAHITGDPLFAIDASPGLTHAAVAVAGRTAPDSVHVELADARPGTAWLPDRVASLLLRHPGAAVVVFADSPAMAVLPDLLRAGVEVDVLPAGAHAQACQHLQRATAERSWTHTAEPVLDGAFAAAVARPSGDGMWTWSRRRAGANIAPLVAVTAALWGEAARLSVAADPVAFTF